MKCTATSTWFLSKVPITTFKNSVAYSANSHRAQGPRISLKCLGVILLLSVTLTQITAIPFTIFFPPNPTSMQNLDGTEEVIIGQHLVATCLVREDKHRLTVRHFRDCQGRDARRQLHHVELPQFHVLEGIVGGTSSVKFVLKFSWSPHLGSFFRTSRASIAITIVRNHHLSH